MLCRDSYESTNQLKLTVLAGVGGTVPFFYDLIRK